MPLSKPMLVFALLIITLGVGMLVNAMGVLAGVDLIWPGILAVLGLLVLSLAPFDKLTFVTGPMLLAAAVVMVLYEAEALNTDYATPCVIIFFGLLVLLATLAPIPAPRWMTEDPDDPLPPGK